MSDFNDTPVHGTIAGINGTNPGPATGISYTVNINKPGGGVMTFNNVKPVNARPTAADIDAAQVGTFVSGWIISGSLYVTIIEQYAGGGCP